MTAVIFFFLCKPSYVCVADESTELKYRYFSVADLLKS